MKVPVFALCAVMLTGCATVRDTYAPDGRKAHALNCSGKFRGWDKCYSAAGDLCKGAGYDILDRTGESTGFASVGGSGGSFGGSAVQTTERTMVVACKR